MHVQYPRELSNTEKDFLKSLYPYAQAWGYADYAENYTHFERRLNADGDLQRYYILTNWSDILWRNICRVQQFDRIFDGDVYTKIRQAAHPEDMDWGTMTVLQEYFQANQDVKALLQNYQFDNNASMVFRMIILAGKLLVAWSEKRQNLAAQIFRQMERLESATSEHDPGSDDDDTHAKKFTPCTVCENCGR